MREQRGMMNMHSLSAYGQSLYLLMELVGEEYAQ